MPRVLDTTSSSQRWTTGERAFCDESSSDSLIIASDTQAPPPSPLENEMETNKQGDKTLVGDNVEKEKDDENEKVEKLDDKTEVTTSSEEKTFKTYECKINLKRPSVLAENIAQEILDSLDLSHVPKGTHAHIRNNKVHLCTLTPIAKHVDGLKESREDIMATYYREMDKTALDFILQCFQEEKMSICEPVTRKFTEKNARLLFVRASFNFFNYECLTVHDCEEVRKHHFKSFGLKPCACKNKYSLDISTFENYECH